MFLLGNTCWNEGWFDEFDQHVVVVAVVDHGCHTTLDCDALLLKLRRTPVAVPSTYLWQRTIEDLHVNSIWQRLRKNLLLLLQLLVIAALILACLRPGFRGDESLGNRAIFMIDNSCSMQATDVEPNRLSAAKKRALEMLDSMSASDVAMVIAFNDRADVRQGFTSDRRFLGQPSSRFRQPIERPT